MMHPSHEHDRSSSRQRVIPWARWLGIALGIMAVLAIGLYWWARSYMTITVAADTTYLTTPLLADGYPDYLGYMNTQNSAGVTAENNAWVAILRTWGPKEIEDESRAEHFRLLGIAPLPEDGDYFQPFYDQTRVKQLPDDVLIAASVAAQMPLHVRVARLAALNVEKAAERAAQEALYSNPEPAEVVVLGERLKETIAAASLSIEEYAEDPATAEQRAAQEALVAAEPDAELAGDDEQIQDLRPAALNLIKPLFNDPEEEAAWRREIFDSTAEKLLDRESLIVDERPWSRTECPLAAQWLDQYSGSLDELQRELAQRPKFYVPNTKDKHNTISLLPTIQTLRSLSMGANTRVFQRLQQNDIAGAIRDFEFQLRLSQCLQQNPYLVELLVGYALHGMALSSFKEIALHPAATADDLQKLAALLEQPLTFPSYAQCIDQGERLFSMHYMVMVMARSEKSDLIKNNEYWEHSIVCWDEVLREMNHWYDQFAAAAKTNNYATVQSASQQLAANPNAALYKEWFEKKPWYLLPSQRTETMKHYYSEMFLPSLAAAMQASQRFQIRNDLARTYVALERFRLARGAYPAALAELVPAYLPAVPNDLIDGQPLRYQRTPAGGYRAYSIWINGVDDGGTPVVDADGEVLDYQQNDLVIGSPDEIKPKQLFGW
jgi:Tfp pilus assembly protein PilE